MKLFTLILSFTLAYFVGSAQSLTATDATTPLSGDTTDLLDATVTIHNSATDSLDVMCERIINNLAPGHGSYFCWDICHTESVSISANPRRIAGGGGFTYAFYGYVKSYGFYGKDTVCYNFFDMNNASDAVSVCFAYEYLNTTGIQVLGASASNPLSSASPNPANNLTNINYNSPNINSRIIIYNLLGVAVKEIKLTGKQGALIITTSDLIQGVYYYSLISGEKTLATKKLVVAHK